MITYTEDATYNVLKYNLSRFLPIRIVLRKDENGKLLGLCEDSFSMSHIPSRVRIWWSGKAYSFLGEHNINGVDDVKHNAKLEDEILDPLAEDCPVEINWEAWRSATSKYAQRNAPFRMKE